MEQSRLWTKHIPDIFSGIPSSYSYVTLLNFIFSTIPKFKDFLIKFQRLCFMLSNVGCYILILLEIHYFFLFSFKEKENESKHPFLLLGVKWIYHVPSYNPSWKALGNFFRVSLCISEFDIEHLQIITLAWLTQWGSTVDLHSFNTEIERQSNIFIKAFLLHLFLFDAEAICFLLTAAIIWNGAMLHCRNIIRTGMWEKHLVHSWPELNVTTLFSLPSCSRGLFSFQHSCGVGEYIICVVPVPF